jgi:hypothetical protein
MCSGVCVERIFFERLGGPEGLFGEYKCPVCEGQLCECEGGRVVRDLFDVVLSIFVLCLLELVGDGFGSDMGVVDGDDFVDRNCNRFAMSWRFLKESTRLRNVLQAKSVFVLKAQYT